MSGASPAPASGRSRLEGKVVKILTVGRKGASYLKREFASRFAGEISFMGKKRVEFSDAEAVAVRVTEMLEAGEFDVCSLIYNRFRNVITQIPTDQRLIPAPLPEGEAVRRHRPAVAVRIRAGRGGHPRLAAAAQPGDPDLPRRAGKHRRLLWQPDDRDGQCHAQCR